jgi:Ca2+:H+ antiporter
METCQRCYWDQANALTDQFYQSSVKPFSYICSVFLVASYVIGLWFSLRTHAAIIWETPAPNPEYGPHHSSSLSNWRRNIPDEPFLKRIGERMSTRFLSGEHPSSPVTERAAEGQANARRFPSASDTSHISTLTPEDSAAFVRNVAEVAAAAATLAVRHSQTSTPQPGHHSQQEPSMDAKHLDSTGVHPHMEARVSADWDAEAEVLVVGGHDAPNWSRTKSSVILLGATILYAVIAGTLLVELR